MSKKRKGPVLHSVRRVDDGFQYVRTADDSPEAFRQRMAARAAAAKMPTAIVENIRKLRSRGLT